MINKSLHNIIFAVALSSLAGVAVAESAGSDVDPLFINEQTTQIPSEYILSEMYTVVNSKSPSKNTERENSVQNHKNNSTMTTDNFEWIPEDWYSGF